MNNVNNNENNSNNNTTITITTDSRTGYTVSPCRLAEPEPVEGHLDGLAERRRHQPAAKVVVQGGGGLVGRHRHCAVQHDDADVLLEPAALCHASQVDGEGCDAVGVVETPDEACVVFQNRFGQRGHSGRVCWLECRHQDHGGQPVQCCSGCHGGRGGGDVSVFAWWIGICFFLSFFFPLFLSFFLSFSLIFMRVFIFCLLFSFFFFSLSPVPFFRLVFSLAGSFFLPSYSFFLSFFLDFFLFILFFCLFLFTPWASWFFHLLCAL